MTKCLLRTAVVSISILCLISVAAAAFQEDQGFGSFFEMLKKTADPGELYTFLYDMPKGGDLHNHIQGGGNFAEMWFNIAIDKKRNGGNEFYTRTHISNSPGDEGPWILYQTIQKSTYDRLSELRKKDYTPMVALNAEERAAWLSSVRLDKPGEGRTEFFDMTWPRLGELIRDPTITTELLVENMQQFASEHVRYIEGMAGAAGMQDHEGKLVDPEDMVERYRKRLAQPDALATGITMRFILSVLRFGADAPERLEQNYAFIDKHRDLFVGVNIVGQEDNDRGYPLRFLETFRKMRRTYSNIGITLHGGEGVRDNNNFHVRESLLLGATRIGHGVNLITDPDTLLLMRYNKYLIEVCLVSNQLVEYTPDPSMHPFPEYLRLGIPVSLNTDDRGMWDSNMTDEYYMASKLFNISWDEILEMGRNSLRFSFVQPDVKQRLIKEFDRDISEFEKKYNAGNWREKLPGVKVAISGYARRNFGVKAPQ